MIFLNHFRWSSEIIAWKELLLLLEGQRIHLPSPKNHYVKEMSISAGTPFVATSKCRIRYKGRYNNADALEDDMINARWKVFEFLHQIL